MALGSVAGVKTPAVVFSYPANVDVDFRIRSDGCPQADVKDGDAWVEVDGIRHHLVQIHWHAPAEHAVGGRTQSDMEAHFVHSPPLVYAVMLNAAGKVVDPVLEAALSWNGMNNASRQIQLSSVVPTGDQLVEYWYGSCRFQPTASLNSSHSRCTPACRGSLTTPPCTEGVTWLVDPEPRRIGRQQLAAFQALRGPVGNARPLVEKSNRQFLTRQVKTRE